MRKTKKIVISMKYIKMIRWFAFSGVLLFFIGCAPRLYLPTSISPPKLTSNPQEDVILTNSRPLLSFFNSKGGRGKRQYTIQIDKAPSFDSTNLIKYVNIPETSQVTSKRIEKTDKLDDNTIYYWRVRATDATMQKSPWDVSKFFLDTSSDDKSLNIVRASIKSVRASCGSNESNIIDIGDKASDTYWKGLVNYQKYWIEFDLGKPVKISRIWQLFEKSGPEGRLKDYNWECSNNGADWNIIVETITKNSDVFRRIIKIEKPVTARYLKLNIQKWHGKFPKIYEIILYSPGVPTLPKVPETDYVLIVGNRHNGKTFGKLSRALKGTGFNIKTVIVPYYEVSLNMIRKIETKPIGIILSGFGRWYEDLPMFEFNGEYEIIRECQIPILGICGGHQLIVMSTGYSYARDMGYFTKVYKREHLGKAKPIRILKKDSIFSGISDSFYAFEYHGWEVVVLPDNIEKLAVSDSIEVIKAKDKVMYGVQFHPERDVSINQATEILANFLKIAFKKKNH